MEADNGRLREALWEIDNHMDSCRDVRVRDLVKRVVREAFENDTNARPATAGGCCGGRASGVP